MNATVSVAVGNLVAGIKRIQLQIEAVWPDNWAHYTPLALASASVEGWRSGSHLPGDLATFIGLRAEAIGVDQQQEKQEPAAAAAAATTTTTTISQREKKGKYFF